MNETILEIKALLLGDHTLAYYIGGYLIASLGIIISLFYSSTKRDPKSPNTPEKFSLLFLVWDNLKRILVSMILMYLIFRTNKISDIWLMFGIGVVVTVFFDQLIEFVMSKSELVCKMLGMNRDNFPKKGKEDPTP